MADLIPMLAAVAGQAGEEANEDENFNQTTLLLHGDGTNGAQNNTFLDSSTNNRTITRNGNATQGTFSPFSVGAGEWSVASDGSGDNLSIAYNSALDVTQGDFTVEFWIFRTAAAAVEVINQRAASTGWLVRINADSTVLVGYAGGGATVTSIGTLPVNEWTHVAAARESNTIRIFFNGVLDNTGTGGNGTTSTAIFYINRSYISSGGGVTGNLSNLRIVKGTAVYTSGFTVPTAPLTAIANTSLLTLQSNGFVDNSTNAFAITSVGNIAISAFSPFVPSAAYSASTNGGSGYFDGTGDYLSIADAAGLRFGTGNFTIQAWVYRNAAGVTHTIAAKGGASTGWVLQVLSTNVLRFIDTTTNIDSVGIVRAAAWNHIAVVREGTGTNQTKLYINGVNDGQATVTTDFNQTEQLNIGADRGNANPMNGYISGFKYVVGTAETITVPTAPPTGGTALLNFTNAGIFDNTGKNNLETVGNAQINTTTKKYGTGSLEFDGTGDWLLLPHTLDQQLRTATFTIEFWVYLASGDTGSNRGLVGKGTASTGFLVSLNTTEKVVFTFTTSTITSTGSINLNSWNHIAVVRAGTGTDQTKIYINGTNDGTGTVSTDFNQTSVMYVGANRTGGDPMKGFIDDLRITKGVARYTTNYSAPGRAFPDF
jgi:hypothetical protein